ncbi:MAG: hypothetical protein V7752_11735 [Halopseudomonas sp.]
MSRLRRHLSLRLAVLSGVAWLALPSVLLAESLVGLPYLIVPAGISDNLQSESYINDYFEIKAEPINDLEAGFIEIAADPVMEPEMIEVPPDRYSRGYRSGIDVYRYMAEHSFDDEPMLVVYAKADPAMALPEVVVIAASIDPNFTHVTAAEAIIDPIVQGEDRVYLHISTPPEPPAGVARPPSPVEPMKRRFFTDQLQ